MSWIGDPGWLKGESSQELACLIPRFLWHLFCGGTSSPAKSGSSLPSSQIPLAPLLLFSYSVPVPGFLWHLFSFLRKPLAPFLIEAYSWFLAAYQKAAERLRAGNLNVAFPEGCFPPPLPFVGDTLLLAPT